MHNIACEKETRIKNVKRLLLHNFENGLKLAHAFLNLLRCLKKEKNTVVLFIPYNVIGG
jgi:hypothetical protein